MNLTKLVLKRPVSTLLVILAIVVFGISSLTSMPLEQMSDIDMPMLLVNVVYPGAEASDVEKLVTEPLEDMGEALSGIDSVTSYSMENYCMVLLTYEYGTDTDDAYMDLREKLDALKSSLPDACQDPLIMEMSVDAMPTMTISARSTGGSDVLKYVNDTVSPELGTIPGVAQVEVTGGTAEYVRILLDEEKLNQYGLTISSVSQYLAAANFRIPAGSVSNGSQDVGVTAAADLASLADLRNVTLITGTGSLIHLSDVANVTLANESASSISRYNGSDSISISVTKNQSASTMDVCRRVEKAIAQMQSVGVEFETVYTAADSINSTIIQVIQTLITGVFFTMLVLFLFIGDWRASLIVGASMPLSVLLAIIIIDYMGYSLNIMTGGALIIAIGMIVDNSIVVLESCFRSREVGHTFKEAAVQGATTVGASVLASTITTVVVYLPISLMQGMSGQMFRQLGFTIIFTMLASLVSALSVVPLFFSKVKPIAREELPVNRVLAVFNRFYDKAIRRVLRRKKLTLLAAVILLGVSILAATQLNMELIPSTYDGSIAISASFRSGTKLERIDEQVQSIEQMLLDDENFDTVNLSVSGGSASLTAYAVDGCKRTSADAVTLYTAALAGYTNMDITVSPSGSSSGMSSAMTSAGTEIDLVGTDLNALKKGAAMVEQAMTKVPGVIKIDNDFAQSQTSARVVVDPLRAMNVGLTAAQVSQNVYQTLSGVKALTITMDSEDYDVKLEYPAGKYDNVTALLDQPIATPYGTSTTLGEIADVTYSSALQTIIRQDGLYQIAITATTTGTAKYTAQRAINKAVAALELPAGVSQGSSMMNDMMNEELSGLLRAIITAVFLVFLVMAMQFESVRFSLMVMTCIPFALIGSFLLMFFAGTTFSMVSMMGFLMLMGMVVNNGILLVDTTNQLREELPLEEALVQAGKIRLRPILMTTLTTILSMLPMLFITDPTMAMMGSMAMVIIGGLLASTVMAMFMMPAFYMILSRKGNKRRERGEPELEKEVLPPVNEAEAARLKDGAEEFLEGADKKPSDGDLTNTPE